MVNMVTCPKCGHTFPKAVQVSGVEISGVGTSDQCPKCGTTVNSAL